MKKALSPLQAKRLADQVSVSSIIGNILLSAFKLFAGIYGHSSALISDAVHSASDIVSTVIVMIGMRLAAKEADDHHKYGHDRLECIAAILLAVILAATGLGIGCNGISSIMSAAYKNIAIPGTITLVAAALSIATKEIMYQYTKAAAKKIQSTSLMADAWHHRSDALSSIGSLLGVLGAQLGFPICDSIASLVICLFILKAACDIFMDAARKLTDTSCDPSIEQKMRETIISITGVKRVDSLRTRQFGNRLYVDVEIAADGALSLYDAHSIAEQVHDNLESAFPVIKHCMVHMNPYDAPQL